MRKKFKELVKWLFSAIGMGAFEGVLGKYYKSYIDNVWYQPLLFITSFGLSYYFFKKKGLLVGGIHLSIFDFVSAITSGNYPGGDWTKDYHPVAHYLHSTLPYVPVKIGYLLSMSPLIIYLLLKRYQK